MSIKHTLTAAIWLFCFYGPLVAQDERPLRVKIIESIKKHEPEWLLTREGPEMYYEFCKCEPLVAVWANGGSRLFYIVYRHKSKEEADANYKFLMERNGFADARESDESYLGELHNTHLELDGPGKWYPSGGSKLYAHFLRRGHEVLMVMGDSPEMVKRFSALIAAEFHAT